MFLQKNRIKQEIIKEALKAESNLEKLKTIEDINLFMNHFLRSVSVSELSEFTSKQIFSIAYNARSFMDVRKGDTPKVRVYNPRMEDSGWNGTHTVIEILNDDMPFLVDSTSSQLTSIDLSVHLLIHPILWVERDKQGHLQNIYYQEPENLKNIKKESLIHIQIDEQAHSNTHAELEKKLLEVLSDVRLAVTDWQEMRTKLQEVIDEVTANSKNKKLIESIGKEPFQEAVEFLKWIDDNHFTFLGYRSCDFELKNKSEETIMINRPGLGLLRDPETRLFENMRNLSKIPQDVKEFLERPEPIEINTANKKSTVHRPMHMDVVTVKRFDVTGKVIGDHRFSGLFTSTAYFSSPSIIPLLRKKVQHIIKRAGFDPQSHDGKTLAHILSTYPRNELFQISEDDLYEISLGILQLRNTQRISLFVRQDPFERFVSCLIYVPRDRFTTELRLSLQAIVEKAFDGQVSSYYTQLTEDAMARLHLIVGTTPGKVPEVDILDLELKLIEIGKSWLDGLLNNLVTEYGEANGHAIYKDYNQSFPVAYQEYFSPSVAVSDLHFITTALEDNELKVNLYRPVGALENTLTLKLYRPHVSIPLSDVMPMLEKMGLRVISEIPFKHKIPNKDDAVWTHFFTLDTGSAQVDLTKIKSNFQEAFLRLWTGDIENDTLNRLVISIGLTWREVKILRSYMKYIRQTGVLFSESYIAEVFNQNAEISAKLIDLFHAFFDPARQNGKETHDTAKSIIRSIYDDLSQVTRLDEDRIIRKVLNLINSTLRVNYYQRDTMGNYKPYISFKFDSTKIDELPLPRPMYEIFVYAPFMEAIHLRGGKVARGGIRWSDRFEDYRTEVLGLIKAQMVKNAVIIPSGSKGGFIAKQLPVSDDREVVMAEVIRCYKTMMRGLLDLTDNIVDGKVVHPIDLVRRDNEDPYLVVAADKGTATFSDIANSVSEEYGFWLGDAFASGGSKGYDHKAMGITARGGWESVKRHFAEMGHDVQTQPFTVIGVGDMAGDVFGNGMLLSKEIKLIAAFNHVHIFVDPNPDTKASWKERQRLFNLKRSTWMDYDKDILSKGGAVYSRNEKSITVSAEVQQALGLETNTMTPNALIREILRAKADLLWFGGIGTFVKAESESNADAGDRSNDRVRINGNEIGAKVIGEGANLGITQRGRIEFALLGGRVNTDAIDNSAGVDCSDHEVNIKIFFGQLMAKNMLTLKKRDKLLEDMTEEVAQLVLRDNYLQTAAISIEESRSAEKLHEHSRLIKALERENGLNREVEFLPNDKVLSERRSQKLGLTRPEIAVLMAYSKLALYDSVNSSTLPDEQDLVQNLIEYFPEKLQKAYPQDEMMQHRLRREIISNFIANSIVNRVGLTFVNEIRVRTGRTACDIARAYTIIRDAFDLPTLWADIESLDMKCDASVQIDMKYACINLIESNTVWLLRRSEHPLKIKHNQQKFAKGLQTLIDSLEKTLDEDDLAQMAERVTSYKKHGVPQKIASKIARIPALYSALDIIHVADMTQAEIPHIAKTYYSIGKYFNLTWLRDTIRAKEPTSLWEKSAYLNLIEDIYHCQASITEQIINAHPAAAPGDAIGRWSADRYTEIKKVSDTVADIRSSSSTDIAMLMVVTNQIREMVERANVAK